MPHLRISMTDPFGLSQVRASCGGPACRDPEGWTGLAGCIRMAAAVKPPPLTLAKHPEGAPSAPARHAPLGFLQGEGIQFLGGGGALLPPPPRSPPPLRHDSLRTRALSAERGSGGEVGIGFFSNLIVHETTVAIALKTERPPGAIHPCFSGTGR
jgi:hypothetical protein